MDARFGSIPGVIRTRVGYTGGTRIAPTYHDLGDHSEAVQVDFDPERVSYEALLDVFWKSHTPTHRSFSKQYRAAVFFHDEDQERLAIKTRDRLAEGTREKIHTAVLPATDFYLAEAYHQKYGLQLEADFYPHMTPWLRPGLQVREKGNIGGSDIIKALQASPESCSTRLPITFTG